MTDATATLDPSRLKSRAIADLVAGQVAPALATLDTLSAAAPADADLRYWLASARLAAGDSAGAGQALNDGGNLLAVEALRAGGVDIDRLLRDAAYAFETGTRAYGAKWPAVATVAFGRALLLGDLRPEALLYYGLSLQHQGRAEEAVSIFRALVEVAPGPQSHQFLLFALFFTENGAERYAEEARRWAALYAPAGAPRPAAAPLQGRRLRIGYVAPNFSRSQLSQFIRPVLEAHDPHTVEIFLYTAALAAEEALPAHAVREIGALPDAQAAARIRADGIDVLVDLWGHTAGSRLPLFALRPAPVQAAWVNFVQTTGLSVIDYVLHSDSMDAPGTQALFTETVLRMGDITIPYRPAFTPPPPGPAPARAAGVVTFGSFNNPVKLTDPTVRAWARILQARAGSRLLLKYSYFDDPVLQRATRARFAGFGVAPERIVFEGHSTGQDYLDAFARLDLALDPSPCPGGTTTCDALANGVPVLTLKGSDFYARIGIQCVATCGLPDLVAESWDDYVDRALDATADPDRLDALRVRTHAGFAASPLRDETGFVRRLEATFRGMVEHHALQAA